VTLRLLVAYDGTDFAGYQSQPHERTVQGVLEEALGTLASSPVRVRGAGRTDAGVHALGQVVSLDADIHPDVVFRAMSGTLPGDVAVTDAQRGPEGFDARRSARSRSYTYLVWACEAPHPLYRRYALWARRPLEAARINEALSMIVGTYDFSSFGRVRSDQTPVRTVTEASCMYDPPFIRIRVTGESFLHNMVRSIVGTALEIGASRRPPSWMRDVLVARDRGAAGPVAPAHGLTLTEVAYDAAPWPRRIPVGWPWSDDVGVGTAECTARLA
jgi:tRNA pseudouridine38-40 synthase